MLANYAGEWRKYRLLRNVWLVLFLGVFTFPFTSDSLTDLSRRLLHDPGYPFLLEIAGMLLWVFVSDRFFWFRCPRCRQPFFRKSWRHDAPFTEQCVHGGLPKFSGEASPDTCHRDA
jgi:hypothetical protein